MLEESAKGAASATFWMLRRLATPEVNGGCEDCAGLPTPNRMRRCAGEGQEGGVMKKPVPRTPWVHGTGGPGSSGGAREPRTPYYAIARAGARNRWRRRDDRRRCARLPLYPVVFGKLAGPRCRTIPQREGKGPIKVYSLNRKKCKWGEESQRSRRPRPAACARPAPELRDDTIRARGTGAPCPRRKTRSAPPAIPARTQGKEEPRAIPAVRL
jgi:hypothetical protein